MKRIKITGLSLVTVFSVFGLSTAPALAAGNGNAYETQFNGAETAETSFEPYGLAVGSGGNVYVANGANYNSVDVYEPNGGGYKLKTEINEVNGLETAGGYFYAEGGVGVNSSGDVAVADDEHGVVDVFEPEPLSVTGYKLKAEVALGGSSPHPAGPVFSSSGDLYVGDIVNDVVDVYEPSGGGYMLIHEIRGTETVAGSFEPTGVAVNSSGSKVYVADAKHNVVDVYEPGGGGYTLVHEIKAPVGEFSSFGPYRVAVAGSGYVYVGDTGNQSVERFSSAGVYECHITGEKEESPPVNEQCEGAASTTPQKAGLVANALAVGPSGKLYVGETEHKLVDVFTPGPAIALPSHLLTVEKEGSGSGTVVSTPAGITCGATCSAEFEEGTKVTLNGTASAGSTFAKWTGCEAEPAGECEVTMSEAKTVKAEFKLSAPSNTGLPAISGVEKEGHTLSATNGTWSGSPSSYTYQWEDCNASGEACSSILDAESGSYTLTSLDVGHTIRVLVTAKNAGGSSSPAESLATGVIAALAGEASVSSNVYGEVEQAVTLGSTCSNVNLGPFLPSATNASYEKTCTVTATSTLAESALTAEDSSATDKGHLVNGSYDLTDPLETMASETEGAATGGGTFKPLTSPVTLLSYPAPWSANAVTVAFKQAIPGHEGLRTGTYAKTITITLAAPTP